MQLQQVIEKLLAKEQAVALVLQSLVEPSAAAIGLGVIAMLKAKGVRHIVASDYSPTRRKLARAMGAHVVVDPSEGSPYEGLAKRGFVVNAPQLFDMALDGMSMLRLTPFPFGKRSVEFTLTEFSGDTKTAVFSNPDHDFPKSFTYRWPSKDQLMIQLVGEMGGQDLTVALDLKRK